jgi:predicted extracellular nuclease
MMNKLLYFFLAFGLITCASKSNQSSLPPGEMPDTWSLAFYNVENLFDTKNDSKTDDEDFTPAGANKWTPERMGKKITNLAKVIRAMDEGAGIPLIIGLCEVENDEVTIALAQAIRPDTYGIVHKESPDHRGIDVALLYDESQFKVISKDFLSIDFSEKGYTSREILYAQLRCSASKEDLHVFVNHWPSRRGGEDETEQRRMDAANTLKKKVDEVRSKEPTAQIIIMGDFNDYPDNRSLTTSLGAVAKDGKEDQELVNLAYALDKANKGTYTYKGDWGMLDQIIVSDNLLKKKGIYTKAESLQIFRKDFMMYYDKNVKDSFPNRTYGRDKYYGGYSDHLPLRLTLSTHH